MITLQYLEPGPHIAALAPQAVGDKLQKAFDILPVNVLLLGWDIPSRLEEVCREVAAQFGTKLYRWHPLLTGDGTIYPKDKWRTRNWAGQPLSGFRDLPEFTFICPNHPVARDTILQHIADLAQSGRYEGIFLDRMRFPSPAPDPMNTLACFCEHCQQAAANFGLDLDEVVQALKNESKTNIMRAFFGEKVPLLSTFLDFRQHAIAQFIREAVGIIRSQNLAVQTDQQQGVRHSGDDVFSGRGNVQSKQFESQCRITDDDAAKCKAIGSQIRSQKTNRGKYRVREHTGDQTDQDSGQDEPASASFGSGWCSRESHDADGGDE